MLGCVSLHKVRFQIMESPADILPAELKKPVVDAKLLLVGAGGIGCEVLKNLVLAGFNNIEVVSLEPCQSDLML